MTHPPGAPDAANDTPSGPDGHPGPATVASSPGARSLFVARLSGSQAEMGAQHARLVARDAARLIDFYRTMPERMLAGDLGAAGRLAVRALATAWQARLARERPAAFAARTRAFVETVAQLTGQRRRGAHLAYAAMDALQNTVSLAAWVHHGPFAGAASARGVAAAAPACSTAIAWGRTTDDGELLFARNFDFPGVGVWDASPAFVVCAPSGDARGHGGQRYGFFATRGADTPVVTVVNEAGLVLAPHTRFHRDVTLGGAMIVDLVHAIGARAETLADAIAIAREHRASSSWGLAVGSAREKAACVIEVAGPHVDVVWPAPGAEYLVCTNRYRSAGLAPGELTASHAWAIHPDRRERRLRALIEGRSAPLTARDLAGFLGDRVDPADASRRRQLGAILAQPLNVHCAVVAPARRTAHVGIDRAPCCEGAWAELTWDWGGPAGGWEAGGGVDAPAGSGFAARVIPGFVAPHTDVSRHIHAAMAAYEADHDVAGACAALDAAVAGAPDDPSLRLAAAWLALEAGDAARAILHVRGGLAVEREGYRRGQLLLWGARAADRSDPALARRWRDELAALSGEGLGELVAQARRRHRGAPRPNLMLFDAY